MKSISIPAAYIIRKDGVRDKAGFHIPPSYQTEFWTMLESVPSSQLSLSISRPHRPRSTGRASQNHHLNGHIQQICQETGNDFADVKLYVKHLAIRRGYPVKDGVVSLRTGDPVPISESDASAEDCTLLIDEVHQLAAELNIQLREGAT